jgi:hypothetical protein
VDGQGVDGQGVDGQGVDGQGLHGPSLRGHRYAISNGISTLPQLRASSSTG